MNAKSKETEEDLEELQDIDDQESYWDCKYFMQQYNIRHLKKSKLPYLKQVAFQKKWQQN